MATLEVKRKTVEVELPKSKGKVVVYTSFSYGDQIAFLKEEKDPSDPAWPALMVSVESWDFKDKDGNDLPFTKENLALLPLEDVGFLLDKVAEFGREKGFLARKEK